MSNVFFTVAKAAKRLKRCEKTILARTKDGRLRASERWDVRTAPVSHQPGLLGRVPPGQLQSVKVRPLVHRPTGFFLYSPIIKRALPACALGKSASRVVRSHHQSVHGLVFGLFGASAKLSNGQIATVAVRVGTVKGSYGTCQ